MPRGAGGEPRGLSEPTGGVLKKAEVTNKENRSYGLDLVTQKWMGYGVGVQKPDRSRLGLLKGGTVNTS